MDRLQKAHVAFLDEVILGHLIARELARNGDHQPHVRVRQRMDGVARGLQLLGTGGGAIVANGPGPCQHGLLRKLTLTLQTEHGRIAGRADVSVQVRGGAAVGR